MGPLTIRHTGAELFYHLLWAGGLAYFVSAVVSFAYSSASQESIEIPPPFIFAQAGLCYYNSDNLFNAIKGTTAGKR